MLSPTDERRKRGDEGSLVQCWIRFPVVSWVVTGGLMVEAWVVFQTGHIN